MKSSKSFFAEVWENYWHMLRAATWYELFFRIVLPAMIFPIFRLLLRLFLYIGGYEVIANNTIVSFFIQPVGWITAVIFLLLISFITLAEFGGLIVLSRNSYWYLPTKGTSAFLEAIRHTKKVFRLSGAKALLYILVVLPFLQIGFSTSLVPAINIPEYIMDFILNKIPLIILLGFLFLGCLYLMTRWFFAIHFVVIEDDNFRDGLKKSNELTKGHKWRLLGAVFLIQIVAVIVGAVFMAFPDIILAIFTNITTDSVVWDIVFMVLIVVSTMIVTLIPLLLGMPLAVSYSTVLFYRWRNRYERFVPVEERTLEPVHVPLLQRKAIRIIIAVIAVIVVLWGGFRNLTVPIPNRTAVTAHRAGGYAAPENSLSGLAYAIEIGADYSEIDVQVTSDDVVMLTHDTNLKREFGVDKNIWQLTYAQTQELRYESGGAAERMPTLREFLKVAKGNIKVNIEIKPNGHDQTLIRQVVELVEELQMHDQVVITSLDYTALQKVRALNPNLKIGYIMYGVLGDASSLDVDFYSVETTFVTEEFIRNAHLIGREVHVWTVNEQEDMQKYTDMFVDNIITDYPGSAIEVVDTALSDE